MSRMIEIDPKLFVTCRLCLQDTGLYQIVPKVRDTIKFCFDIDVEPFDGLPQLVCKKCEGILSEFYETKTVFQKKQSDLKSQFYLKRNNLPTNQETKYVVEENEFDDKVTVFGKLRQRKRRKISSSSSEFSLNNISNDNCDEDSWAFSYNKEFFCKFCRYHNRKQSDILAHLESNHKQLKDKYHNLLKKHCYVTLSKMESKPNITGSRSTVVLGDGKIIESVDMDYYILYSPKKDNINVIKSSNDENEEKVVLKKKLRKIRLCSKSSNETVVVPPDENNSSPVVEPVLKKQEQKDDNNEAVNEIYECIKIDDSSDSDCDNGNISVKRKSHARLLEKHQETIQSIICVGINNLRKNINDSNVQVKPKKVCQISNLESQLKHKFLSIGRKIVNKQGFNCTGLHRYMEHKDVEITWIPKPTVNSTVNTDYIRIMTKLKDNKENCNTGWSSLPANVEVQNKMFCDPAYSLALTNSKSTTIENDVYNNVAQCHYQNKSKLLNKNPVANPKQLPRKTHISDTNSNNQCDLLTTNHNSSHSAKEDCGDVTADNINENILMPIVTDVISLDPNNQENLKNTGKDDANERKQNIDTPIGRIRVKPNSELLSERILSNYNTEPTKTLNKHELNTNTGKYHVAPDYIPSTSTQNPAITSQAASKTKNNLVKFDTKVKSNKYITLNTVELPNSRTDAPFKYIQNLLQIHNIVLLDTKQNLEIVFLCLIKFMVQFRQESKEIPIFLCISLFVNKNTFCLKVHNTNNDSIDITTISAHWQWEILKTFTGDPINKLLENAEKISKEVYEYTKKFCCLLKSIRCST